jgi:hypothetical protein
MCDYFNLLNLIYCEGDDEITPETNNDNKNQKNIVVESDNFYHIRKDSVDVSKGMDIISKTLDSNFDKLVSNVGAATAAGTAASAVLKSNLPPAQKLALAGASAAVVGASTKIGIAVGEAIVKNNSLNSSIDSKTLNQETPSPDTSFISSVLEKSELISPLEELLRNQFILNILILFLIIIFLVLLFNKLFINNNLINNFIRNNLNKNIILKIDYYKAKLEKFNESYFLILFSINTITLIFNLVLCLIINYELTFNLDSYILVHNTIKFC